jgi:hypothetical protein
MILIISDYLLHATLAEIIKAKYRFKGRNSFNDDFNKLVFRIMTVLLTSEVEVIFFCMTAMSIKKHSKHLNNQSQVCAMVWEIKRCYTDKITRELL